LSGDYLLLPIGWPIFWIILTALLGSVYPFGGLLLFAGAASVFFATDFVEVVVEEGCVESNQPRRPSDTLPWSVLI
jgi:hypothetical protein